MVAWFVAPSLDVLLAQINAMAPNRSKKSDGSVGDLAHQGTNSDHNPEPPTGEVDARDFTHDPANGCNIGEIFEQIRLSCKAGRERRVKYLIFNRRICSAASNWEWRIYTGDNPHDKHGHVSVVDAYDNDTSPWEISNPLPPSTVETELMLLAQVEGSPTVWVGNGVHRRAVTNETNVWALINRGADKTHCSAHYGGVAQIRSIADLTDFLGVDLEA